MKILKLLKQLIINNLNMSNHLTVLSEQIAQTKILTAKSLIQEIKSRGVYENIQETEFGVFSQFGEDGILQYLINNMDIKEKTFIEFGVGNYTESNTRFLLINNNWKGLIIEGGQAYIDYIKKDNIYWKYDLTAVHSFIDKENINNIFAENGFKGDIDLLSIDVDGNDYWIWDCINVVAPSIVVVEYNSTFGAKHALTVPYDPAFVRGKAHYSHLYWGCSLKALCMLAEKKGYCFVGSNSNGNNAFFVRKDKIGDIKPLSVEEGYVVSKFRDSRDERGRLSFLGGEKRLEVISDMVVCDLERNTQVKIKDIGML